MKEQKPSPTASEDSQAEHTPQDGVTEDAAAADPPGTKSPFAAVFAGACQSVVNVVGDMPWYGWQLLVFAGLADTACLFYGYPLFLAALILWAWVTPRLGFQRCRYVYLIALLWPIVPFSLGYVPSARAVMESISQFLADIFPPLGNTIWGFSVEMALASTVLVAAVTLLRTHSLKSASKAGLCAFLLAVGTFPLSFGLIMLFALSYLPH